MPRLYRYYFLQGIEPNLSFLGDGSIARIINFLKTMTTLLTAAAKIF
jgi:hypothetical protein